MHLHFEWPKLRLIAVTSNITYLLDRKMRRYLSNRLHNGVWSLLHSLLLSIINAQRLKPLPQANEIYFSSHIPDWVNYTCDCSRPWSDRLRSFKQVHRPRYTRYFYKVYISKWQVTRRPAIDVYNAQIWWCKASNRIFERLFLWSPQTN